MDPVDLDVRLGEVPVVLLPGLLEIADPRLGRLGVGEDPIALRLEPRVARFELREPEELPPRGAVPLVPESDLRPESVQGPSRGPLPCVGPVLLVDRLAGALKRLGARARVAGSPSAGSKTRYSQVMARTCRKEVSKESRIRKSQSSEYSIASSNPPTRP